jgi:hypothetical protein
MPQQTSPLTNTSPPHASLKLALLHKERRLYVVCNDQDINTTTIVEHTAMPLFNNRMSAVLNFVTPTAMACSFPSA